MMGSKSHLLEVFFAKLVFNLKSETKKTYLSYLWWVLEPAFHVGVFYVVFSIFLNRGTGDFLIFLLCGNIPFMWFSRTVSNASASIVAGKGLISQIAIPKPFFPLLVVAQDAVKQFFVFVFFFLFLIIYGLDISLNWLYVVPIILTQLLLIISIALIAAAITPFLPDFKFLISSGMMMLMFGSGIFYSYKDVLLKEHQELFLLNPIANLLKNYRQVIIDDLPPDWLALVHISLISVFIIIIMNRWFKKADSTYARLVIN